MMNPNDPEFDNAKLGIFVHWGPYSIPAYCPKGKSLTEKLREGSLYSDNPDGAFFEYNLTLDASLTKTWAAANYPGKTYDGFVEEFKQNLQYFNPNDILDVIGASQAKYMVLVSKHHDGFCLWPSQVPNPNSNGNQRRTQRDVVGELKEGCLARDIRFGLYYSGGFDWTFGMERFDNLAEAFLSITNSPEYLGYVRDQWTELIETYSPFVMWNDIGVPFGLDVPALQAKFYQSSNGQGVVNDRFGSLPSLPPKIEALIRAPVISGVIRGVINQAFPPSEPLPEFQPSDFRTLEYAEDIKPLDQKFEATRALGKSFGYNRTETERDILGLNELVLLFIQVISSGGNLLLNIGPDGFGQIPDIQRGRIQEFGQWNKLHSEAIFYTRKRQTGTKGKGFVNGVPVDVYYTSKESAMFVFVPLVRIGTYLLQDFTDVCDVSTFGNEGDIVATPTPAGMQIKVSKSWVPIVSSANMCVFKLELQTQV